MSLNKLGAKKLKKMSQVVGMSVTYAVLDSSHLSGRYVFGVTSEHVHVMWDRMTDKWEFDELMHDRLSSCRRFKEK